MTPTQQFVLALISLIMLFIIMIFALAVWYSKKNN